MKGGGSIIMDLTDVTRNGSGSGLNSAYWIAETAYNHEGDLAYLLQLVDSLGNTGVNAVKFHLMLNLDSYMVAGHSIYPLLQKWLFSKEQWRQVFERCRQAGLAIVGLADEPEGIDFLLEEQADALAVHASCMLDYVMLKRLSMISQPLLIGIGGASRAEIAYALKLLQPKRDFILMYGIQHYPTPPSSIHLQKLPLLQAHFDCPTGYADHTAAEDTASRLLAYADAYGLGGRVFEQHVTLDLGSKREDDESAIEAPDLAALIRTMKVVAEMTGVKELELNDEEKNYAKIRKRLVASADLSAGKVLEERDIEFKITEYPGDLEPQEYSGLIGKKLSADIAKGEAFRRAHIG